MERLEPAQPAIAPAGRDAMRSNLGDAELANLKALRDARVRTLLARRVPRRDAVSAIETRQSVVDLTQS